MSIKKDISLLPSEKFKFVQEGTKLSDKKFDNKPVGYFKDAWRRFRKNKASVVAMCIIIFIVLFAFLTPLLNTNYDSTFKDIYYQKKAPRNLFLSQFGICDGGTNRSFSESGLIKTIAVGIAAEDKQSNGDLTIAQGLKSKYQPILNLSEPVSYIDGAKNEKLSYPGRVEVYYEIGFIYKSVEQEEYKRIVEWQEKTGLQVLYPLIEENEFYPDTTDANYWYKAVKYKDQGVMPVSTADGLIKRISYSENMKLEDNYMRDNDGNAVFYQYTGGGNINTAQYKVRILYYNYYIYQNGFEPEYIFGTDSVGFDLSLRLAGGIKLSLLIAVCVSIINFIIGAIYGAIEGYYGGVVDITLERVSDILAGVPFIVVATLFQIHLAAKVGAVPSLLFAFVLTGWIGTASRVRTQFYRFKNQEYVMAARTLGARDRRIIWKHIFPNSLGTIITSSALVIPGVIGAESMLSYLGIVKLGGTNATSLGTLLSDASSIWTNFPHLMVFPAITISLLMICFNLFGNGLRDAFNPSLRGVED
ncbi:MAG: ABC transporter permease [Eubacteriales bacterium]|nr:ABC transporter permease [Eubacteriales bacterium]